MRLLGLVLAFFWGIGQNLPYGEFYLAGICPGDLLFLMVILFAAVYPSVRPGLFSFILRLRGYLYLIVAFVWLTLFSFTINAFTWGFEWKDLIEVFRPFYYFMVVAYIANYTYSNGPASVVQAFLAGILVSGIIAYLNPGVEDLMGFALLWNPNVIGNMLAIGIVFASLLILNGRFLSALPFVAAFLILAVFTFSKGTWLMSLLGLIACIAAFSFKTNRRSLRIGKLVFCAGVVGLLVLGMQHYEDLHKLISFKLLTSQLEATAAEGGTISARYGFVIASLQLAVENPLTGVGISNFESAYNSLKGMLGDYYWETDNPHSAWLYVLACIGFPGLVVLMLLVLYPIRQIASLPELRNRAKVLKALYICCVGAVFVISGAVQLQLLTQYFLWFFTGVVSGSRTTMEYRKPVLRNATSTPLGATTAK
jgi:O-antigen ligase